MTTATEQAYIWERVKELPSCDHVEEIRRRTIRGGSRPIYAQCIKCGKSLGSRPSKHLPAEVLESLPPFDDAAFQAYVDRKDGERDAMWREARRTRSGPWWERYQAHLQTPEWASKRRRVLKRDRNTCQACLSRPAAEVHHTDYRHMGHEPLFDLVAVCKVCHDALTQMDVARDEAER